jgi:recombination protein RecR
MKAYHETLSALIDAFADLPGLGRRSAERIVMYLLKASKSDSVRLSELLLQLREKTQFCKTCNHYSDGDICPVCADPSRDAGIICVVEDPRDLIALEKTGTYSGQYHVLLGAISALDGIGPEEIRLAGLMERVKSGKVREVILATNPNTEGDTTAFYITKLLKPLGIKTTRIARGVPVGNHLEYTDAATLSRAMEGRVSA